MDGPARGRRPNGRKAGLSAPWPCSGVHPRSSAIRTYAANFPERVQRPEFHRQPGALLHVKRGRVKEETTTPHYVLCQDCSKEFTQILHIADLKKGVAMCPHCGGKRVTQKAAAFSAVTSEKS